MGIDSSARRTDVALIGLGPVGAVLATLLGRSGLAVTVFERDPDVHPLPRAVHFDGETMRVFQAAGLADRVAAAARPTSHGMHFVDERGATLLVRRGIEGAGPHGWKNNWYFHQPNLERALRSGLAEHANVRVMLEHEVESVVPTAGDVSITVRNIRRAESFTVQARYVIGCDGARSMVRAVIGSSIEDLGLHQPWLVVDALVDLNSPRAGALPDRTHQICDPARPMTLVHVGENRWRWEIMLMPGDDPATIARPASLWPMLARWLEPGDARLERAAVYTFHSLIAHGWRRGRLLLAGDSCHQTPPFLGQGMCAGIRDAANLAWKLEWVVRGRATEALLDTYESERKPHVRAFIELAVKVGAIIQATDPAAVRERDRQFGAGAAGNSSPQFFDYPQPQLGPGLRGANARPASVVFPQPDMDDGRRLDDWTGVAFVVLGDASTVATARAAVGERWRAVGARVIDTPGRAIAGWLADEGARAIILRPDRYVFGIARDASELIALSRELPGN